MALRKASILGVIFQLHILCLHIQPVTAYNQATCCELAKSEQKFTGLIPDIQICGQTYNKSIPAAEPLFVTYKFCASRCSGVQLSQAGEAKQWAASIVQFILPSVIFSMTIPRRKKIEFDYLFEFSWPGKLTRWGWFNEFVELGVSAFCFAIILIPVVLDTMIWIIVIICGAGNMIVGGLYEAHLDWRICRFVKGMKSEVAEDLVAKRELLVTITSGNLMLDKGNPQKTIPKSIAIPSTESATDGLEKGRSRLLNLLGAQTSFGSAVGSPVLFYMGAFVYSILDLRNDPSNEDSAESLGFGMEWMIIVHVAMISGCLLASNNPSTSAGIVGTDHEALKHPPKGLPRTPTLPSQKEEVKTIYSSCGRFTHLILGWSNTYETSFQPVSLWGRGSNKMKWIKLSSTFQKDNSFRRQIHITPLGWLFKILIPSLILIVLPPAAGGVVAYFTPPRGIGCRSLSFITYASCQVACTLLATIRCAVDSRDSGSFAKELFSGRSYVALSTPFWFGSLIAAIGGTTMQIVGVYRNCICYANANTWWNIDAINPAINLASDTLNARNASGYWIWMGSTATVFMALNCYFGWWYQRLVRKRFTDAVKDMYTNMSIEGIPLYSLTPDGKLSAEGRDSMGSNMPLLERRDSAHSWAEMTTAALSPENLNLKVGDNEDNLWDGLPPRPQAMGMQRIVVEQNEGGVFLAVPNQPILRPRAYSC
jgi:hypothetical protein